MHNVYDHFQVLVKVHAIGVNPVETYIRAGMFGPRNFPFILGMDCAGEVESVGGDVKKFKVKYFIPYLIQNFKVCYKIVVLYLFVADFCRIFLDIW